MPSLVAKNVLLFLITAAKRASKLVYILNFQKQFHTHHHNMCLAFYTIIHHVCFPVQL